MPTQPLLLPPLIGLVVPPIGTRALDGPQSGQRCSSVSEAAAK